MTDFATRISELDDRLRTERSIEAVRQLDKVNADEMEGQSV